MNLLHGAAVVLLLALQAHAPGRAIWVNVPFVAQPHDGCGAASVAMVMQYWATQQHRPVSSAAHVHVIQKQVFTPRLHGATPAALEKYLRQHGFLAFAVSGSWQELHAELEKGRPLIVAIRPPGQRALHYVVIDGINPERETIMMNDPEIRKLLPESRKQFEKDWSATHRWMLLALPRPHRHGRQDSRNGAQS